MRGLVYLYVHFIIVTLGLFGHISLDKEVGPRRRLACWCVRGGGIV